MTNKVPIVVKSGKFGDTYFSKDNGIKETRHVFLQGNNLPDAWKGQDNFVIAETGFGTGLNFLTTWELFDQTAAKGQTLNYVSAELYPIDREYLSRFLVPLFGKRARTFLARYPWPVPGYHRVNVAPNVSLTLIYDDVVKAFSLLKGYVDCWFLDGFTPALNPDMWSNELFQLMARLSHKQTSFATFTAAGHVKRGLEEAGFKVEKTTGFGRKRDMLKGRFLSSNTLYTSKTGRSSISQPVAIIGGGLAGAAAAYALRLRGINSIILEADHHLASGASGNWIGLFNPRPFAGRHTRCDYHVAGLELVARTARHLANDHDIDFRLQGCLHLTNDHKKKMRHFKAIDHMGWGDYLRYVSPSEASAIAGLKLQYPCLYSPLAGAINPIQLVKAYTQDCEIRLLSAIDKLEYNHNQWVLKSDNDDVLLKSSYVIVTRPILVQGSNGQIIDFSSALRPVRGQVTEIISKGPLQSLRCNLAHGGYIARGRENRVFLGATFQRGVNHAKATANDDFYNFYQLKKAIPDFSGKPHITKHRASVRLTTADHMPFCGKIDHGLYVSSGWGSHGILGTLLGAEMICDMMLGHVVCVPKNVCAALDPARFFANTHQTLESKA